MRKKLALLFAGSLLAFHLSAQWKLVQLNGSSQRTTEDTYLTLPFFDDFSQSALLPDTTKWQPNGGTVISNAFALKPPTLNMVSFDGANQIGIPYEDDPDTDGVADSLTTHLFDLSGFATSEQLTIGFYWLSEGLGELPNQGSTIALYGLALREGEESWELLWEQETPGETDPAKPFQWEEVTLTDPAFFHDRFRFSFVNTGSLNGAFDNWHLDYIVFFSKNQFDPTTLRDISWGAQATSSLNKYRAMPFSHLNEDVEFWLADSVVTDLVNVNPELNAINPPFCKVYDRNSGAEIGDVPVNIYSESGFKYQPGQAVLVGSFTDPITGLTRGERLTYSIQNKELQSLLSNATDSVEWEYRLILDPLENEEFIPTRLNDTLRHEINFNNYYAYDDGSAEYAAGINKRFGKLAYQFVAAKPDVISHIDLHVVGIGPDISGQSFSLMIWSSIDTLDERNDEVLLRQTIPIQIEEGVNAFHRYELGRYVTVQDTFYIGIEQLQDDFIPIGYDLNSTSGENVFYNVASRWVKNESLPGSLMIRPVFDPQIPTGIEDELFPNLAIYPNPAKNFLKIDGEVLAVEVYNLEGKQVLSKSFSGKRGGVVETFQLKEGLYILRAIWKYGAVNKKLMIAP